MIIHLAPDAPLALRMLAGSALVAHIGGGAVGIAAGGLALVARKGGPIHRRAGDVFVVAMLTAYLVGAAAAPFIHQPANVFGGLFAAYLIATGWLTVRRPAGQAGMLEIGGFLLAAAAAISMSVFAWYGAHNPHGIDGVPWQAGAIFAVVGGFAAWLDLRVILAGGVSGPARLARHVWRMCLALWTGAASVFLGQPKVWPEPLRGSFLLWLPEIAILVAMVYWLIRLRPRRPAPTGLAPTPA